MGLLPKQGRPLVVGAVAALQGRLHTTSLPQLTEVGTSLRPEAAPASLASLRCWPATKTERRKAEAWGVKGALGLYPWTGRRILSTSAGVASGAEGGREMHPQANGAGPEAGAEAGAGAGTGRSSGASDAPPGAEQRDTVLVLGGSGFVGSAVCRAALDLGVPRVASLSRTGLPPALASAGKGWVEKVEWHRGDLFEPQQWASLLPATSAVVSCVGAFGSSDFMKRVNGEANVLAIQEAARAHVPRFVYISAHDFGLLGRVIPPGYYQGKRMAEAALREHFPDTGVVLLPGVIYGPRLVGSIQVPLQLVGAPLSAVLTRMPWLQQAPVLGPALVPPVPVSAVGKAAALAATGRVVDPVLTVAHILRLGST